MIFTILVCFFAGMGAGIGTGFAGMSAAAVISPMLITFLGMDPYQQSVSHLPAMCSPVRSQLILTAKTKTWMWQTES